MTKDKSVRQRAGKDEKTAKKDAKKAGKGSKDAVPHNLFTPSTTAMIVAAIALGTIQFFFRRATGLIRPKPPSLLSVPADLGLPSAPTTLSYFKFGWSESLALKQWSGKQSPGSFVLQPSGAKRSINLVHSLLTQAELDAFLAAAKARETSEHETYFMQKGEIVGAFSRIVPTLSKVLEERLTPYVRQQLKCLECTICEVMVDRFTAGEQAEVSRHPDNHMKATLVVPLNPTEHTGGFYVQPGSSREFIQFQPGDVAAHQYYLEKGVDVPSGTRYALHFWFKDVESCKAGTAPWYKAEAEAGHPEAQVVVGSDLLQHEYGSKGIEYMKKAVEHNNLDALTTLGVWMIESKTNVSQGKEHLEYAASWGHSVAEFNLGMLHFNGGVVAKNEKVGAEWSWRSAFHGHLRAIFQMGMVHKFGVGAPANPAVAHRWFELAAKKGALEAMMEMYNNYKKGDQVQADPAKALEWLQKAADGGSKAGRSQLGIEYLSGEIVELNNTRAAGLLESAAREGDSRSQLLTAELYAVGIGVVADRDAARSWMKKAVAQGLHREAAQVLEGIERDSGASWKALLDEEDDDEDLDDLLGSDDDEEDILGSDEEDAPEA